MGKMLPIAVFVWIRSFYKSLKKEIAVQQSDRSVTEDVSLANK